MQIYGYRCAISGLKIKSLGNTCMVDACHIIPFAESFDDTISNGLALSPTIHRAFDRGLLSIDKDYKVIISTQIIDFFPNVGIMQFDKKKIHLPKEFIFYPSIENLREHRKRFGI